MHFSSFLFPRNAASAGEMSQFVAAEHVPNINNVDDEQKNGFWLDQMQLD